MGCTYGTMRLRYRRSFLRQLKKLRRQLWPRAFVFMLEKDEGVFPFLILHAFHPLTEIVFVVGRATQAQVSPLRRADDFGERFLVGIGNYQRAISCMQQIKGFIVEP